jgi:cytochrome c
MPTFRFIGTVTLCIAVAALVSLPSIASSPAPDGATLYRQRCQSCHAVVAAQKSGVGPNLRGVLGRKAAATAFNYSAAMKQSNIVWTKANLDRYLKAPTKMVPGTRMVIAVNDAAQRAAIIKYLAQMQ